MTVPYPPICISCANLLPKRGNLMSCKAFEIIPGVIALRQGGLTASTTIESSLTHTGSEAGQINDRTRRPTGGAGQTR
jgi:hypothetical protein